MFYSVQASKIQNMDDNKSEYEHFPFGKFIQMHFAPERMQLTDKNCSSPEGLRADMCTEQLVISPWCQGD